jgi:phospholipid/cholesterol/gamma-HCH transport system permease protein
MFLDRLGARFKKKGGNILYALGFSYQVFKETVLFVKRRQVGFRVLIMQILFTGVEAISIISLLALALGAIIIIQGYSSLSMLGQGKFTYTILILLITKELGPVLTAFIIIARSGTAIATEIGHMVVSHEIEAYMSVGINPVSYLVVPRFLGVSISLFLLTLYFNFFGLFASFLITQVFTPIPFLEYFQNLLSALTIEAILSSLVKSVVFGFIISIVSSYHGFKVNHATTEIPKVVINAVVHSLALCIVADLFLVLLFNRIP